MMEMLSSMSHLFQSPPPPQQCPLCPKVFVSMHGLHRHIVTQHNDHRRNGSRQQLQGHLPESRRFPCLECGKAFKFKHHLKEHSRIHSGEKPFVCHVCRKSFSHSGSYSSHLSSKKCTGGRKETVESRKPRVVQTSSSEGASLNVAPIPQHLLHLMPWSLPPMSSCLDVVSNMHHTPPIIMTSGVQPTSSNCEQQLQTEPLDLSMSPGRSANSRSNFTRTVLVPSWSLREYAHYNGFLPSAAAAVPGHSVPPCMSMRGW